MIAPAALPRRRRLLLPDTPSLSPARERSLFLRMDDLKQQAARLRDGLDGARPDHRTQRCIERLLAEATAVRNRIVEANLPLVIAMARPFRDASTPIEELLNEGALPLLRAVELFDVRRGLKFSTYAARAIRNHFLRLRKRRARRVEQETCVDPAAVEVMAINRGDVRQQTRRFDARDQTIERLMDTLPDREQTILAARFGLNGFREEHTFREIASLIGLSKERVRVLSIQALESLREAARQERLEWPDLSI
ncbi:MAG: sigma-70 family RNA polymerase sigma factor [Planctomycetaceae bacterium]